MRVLTLSHELPPLGGGGGRMCYDLAHEVARAGHAVDIVTMGRKGLPRHEKAAGIAIYRVRCLRRREDESYTGEKITYVVAALSHLRKLGGVRQYDLIHCHFILPAGLVAYLATLFRPTPLIITCHGSDVPGYNPDDFALEHRLAGPIWRRVLARTSVLVSPSDAVRQLVDRASHHNGLRIELIPYGFYADRFRCSRREPKILLVSRLVRRKGFQYFLQALRGLDLRGYEVHIVGDGPFRPELEALAREVGAPVRFWGWVDNQSPEIVELFETSSIFVLPSESENFPVSLLEAMTAGLAIITTNVRGCPEVVGNTALLVPPRDPMAIREALSQLVADPELVAQLGDAARRRVKEKFDWSVVTRQYLQACEAAIAKNAGRRR